MALGLYIHIPYCRSKCNYCNFVSFSDLSTQEAYIHQLIQEIRMRKTDDTVDSIYIGGGTPSVLFAGNLTKILEEVHRQFQVASDLECSIEVNPDSFSKAFLRECLGCGVNRFSVGMQSMNDMLLKRAGRTHTVLDIMHTIELLKAVCNNISGDLILGLPGENMQSFERTLDQMLAFHLQHLSLYGLKVEEDTVFQRENIQLDEDFQADLYQCAHERLRTSYERYEVSNYAKEGFACRHNKKYWELSPYIGLGLAAHSYDGESRRENTADLGEYLAGNFLEKEYSVIADKEEEFIMLGLRMKEGISMRRYRELFHKDFRTQRTDVLKELLENSVIAWKEDRLFINEAYVYVMNAVILKLIGA